jgi:serine/threonine protein phosphatase PrpC
MPLHLPESSGYASRVILNVFGSSDVGKVRGRNEDSFIVDAEHGRFAVADGMGGHVAGVIASITALAAFDQYLAATNDASETAVHAAIHTANRTVWQRADAEREKTGMGTTLTALVFAADRKEFVVGHVGDSRLYRLRAGGLEQITRDHTAAQELVDSGQLTKTEARRHPLSSMLYRSIGTRPEVEIDVQRATAQAGDRYLLCSDGLSGMVDDADLAAILVQDKAVPAICAELIGAANLHGGIDNITAIVIEMH